MFFLDSPYGCGIALTPRQANGKIPLLLPPSSRGPGRSPFKAKTGVRISMGALTKTHLELRDIAVEEFLEMLRFEQRSRISELPSELLRECSR